MAEAGSLSVGRGPSRHAGGPSGPAVWWAQLNRAGHPPVFCFGPAGAWSIYFAGLAAAADGVLTVHGLRLPGRERRLFEPPPAGARAAAEAIASAMAALADRPFVVLGVCTGARLAWRTVRRLERGGGPPLTALVVLDSLPPGRETTFRRVLALSPDDLRAHIAAIGAVNPELLDDAEFVEYVLDSFRADLTLAVEPLPPDEVIDAPLVEVQAAFAPSAPDASAELTPPWQAWTAAPRPLLVISGNGLSDRNVLAAITELLRIQLG